MLCMMLKECFNFIHLHVAVHFPQQHLLKIVTKQAVGNKGEGCSIILKEQGMTYLESVI